MSVMRHGYRGRFWRVFLDEKEVHDVEYVDRRRRIIRVFDLKAEPVNYRIGRATIRYGHRQRLRVEPKGDERCPILRSAFRR